MDRSPSRSPGPRSPRSPRMNGRDGSVLKEAAVKVAAMRNEEWVKLTGEYVGKHQDLIRSGDRVLPVTLRGLRHTMDRHATLQTVEIKKKWFGSSPEEKEKKLVEQLVAAFRSCPKLQIAGKHGDAARGGSARRSPPLNAAATPPLRAADSPGLSPEQGLGSSLNDGRCLPGVLDLSQFNALKSLEIINVAVVDVAHPPVGLTELFLEAVDVPLRKFRVGGAGEAIQAIKIRRSRDCQQLRWEDVHSFHESLRHLSIFTSLTNPAAVFRKGLAWFSLIEIRLCDNDFGTYGDCFASLTSVQKLILKRNNLTALSSLKECLSLTQLNLSGNRIEEIGDARAIFPDGLTDLDVSHNRLKGVPESLGKLPKLEKVNVSGNLLQSWHELFAFLDSAPPLAAFSMLENPLRAQISAADCRPLVAGRLPRRKWAEFVLDGRPLQGDDVNPARICAASERFARQSSATDAAACTGVAILALTSCAGFQRKRTRVRVVRRRRNGAARSEVASTWAPGSPTSQMETSYMADSTGHGSPMLSPSPTHDPAIPALDTSLGLGSSEHSGMGKFLDGIATSSKSDGVEEAMKAAEKAAAVEYALDADFITESTSMDWRDLLRELASDMGYFSTSQLVPRASRIFPLSHVWGEVFVPRDAGGEGHPTPLHVTFKPASPPPAVAGKTRHLVALDMCTAADRTYIRIRVSDGTKPAVAPMAFLGHTASEGLGAILEEDAEACLDSDPQQAPACVGADVCGFRTVHTQAFHARSLLPDPPPATVTLCNVRAWEPGEETPWDPRHVNVDPSKNHKYVTTHQGVTYLQRHLQAEIRASFHAASEYTLVGGFEVPDLACQVCLVDELKKRLQDCVRNPQWPLVDGVPSTRAASGPGKQSIHVNDARFRQELTGVREVTVQEQRAGSALQLSNTTATFMHFNSSLQGVREPDAVALEQHGLSVDQYQVHRSESKDDLLGADSLEGSCYCSVLLGNTAEESKEKSCWIAVTAELTYFALDLNYEGAKGKQPFLFVVCHQNAHLTRVEVGHNRQYIRIHYGGSSALSHLLLPRCEVTALNILRLLVSRAPDACVITAHPSPFVSRRLWDGQAADTGYHLVFMRDDGLVKRASQRRNMKMKMNSIKSMAFPQDVYPLRDLTASMLPVSLLTTHEDVVIATDNYASWPDEESKPGRWHIERRAPLSDMTGLLTADPGSSIHPLRFSVEFTNDDEARDTWHFCAQSRPALEEIEQRLKDLHKAKWKADTLSLGTLTMADEPTKLRSSRSLFGR
eukprot:TRINITY_DN24812_c0_g1_i1.p1 TRINITY_DN24812_c0_g1~~TRINITY_DN24812_c0_g1_i1.p1  ORF type:complete len:1267 (+),score=375.96 TRINITY_DN24812_c0_g1_i1:114-3914(+)